MASNHEVARSRLLSYITAVDQPRAIDAPMLTPIDCACVDTSWSGMAAYLHYSRSTEEIYVYWCRAFIRYHALRHPREMGGAEVEAFLTWLADERQVASATHKQALSALLFLYTKVLGVSLPWVQQIERPRVRCRLPVVLSREEVSAVLGGMAGEFGLSARLLYGTGMRINEALQLWIKDVDFAHQSLIVRAGKGGKDRVLMLPQALVQSEGADCKLTPGVGG